MAKLSKKEVEHLARLVRIKLDEQESESLARELGDILEYVKKLDEAPTKDVKSTAQVTGLENVMRKDAEVDYGTDKKSLLSNVPNKTEEGYIKVRRVIEGKK